MIEMITEVSDVCFMFDLRLSSHVMWCFVLSEKLGYTYACEDIAWYANMKLDHVPRGINLGSA